MMKSAILAILTALAAKSVEAHATFQQLWVDGVDYISFAQTSFSHRERLT